MVSREELLQRQIAFQAFNGSSWHCHQGLHTAQHSKHLAVHLHVQLAHLVSN